MSSVIIFLCPPRGDSGGEGVIVDYLHRALQSKFNLVNKDVEVSMLTLCVM